MKHFLLILLTALSFACGYIFESHIQISVGLMSAAVLIIVAFNLDGTIGLDSHADLNKRLSDSMTTIESLVQENKAKVGLIIAERDRCKHKITRLEGILKRHKIKFQE
jgi:hypothetical protein